MKLRLQPCARGARILDELATSPFQNTGINGVVEDTGPAGDLSAAFSSFNRLIPAVCFPA
ncbi:hypothetical protein GBZ26_16365 [Azospirillum formosense]|uniref:Uncharacterized protein n=1 Tax=Azospirillum formosense TaxID=861533 RepID=A0ABX2KVT3_9PROT|nr:hypothetical protein [Azospirillum formosense]NUB20768.1 hypothetical protein [Azospirillum formosense]